MFYLGEELTKENLLKRVDTYSIFKYYCTHFSKVGEKFKSEFRSDSNPSCMISQISGDLLYKDFGEEGSYRAVDYVMRKFSTDFRGALEIINRDFNLGLGYGGDVKTVNTSVYTVGTTFREKVLSDIKVKSREFSDLDREFWNRFGISIPTLKLFKIKAISHFWVNENLYYAAPLAYSFDFYRHRNVFMRKIYQPESIDKWKSNTDETVVQGEIILPKAGDLLIITKSLKDVACLYELGYTAIAPISESTFVPEGYLFKQQSRFRNIVLLLDNDKVGIERSKVLSERWNIPYILIPQQSGSKDISDYVKDYSKQEASALIQNLCGTFLRRDLNLQQVSN